MVYFQKEMIFEYRAPKIMAKEVPREIRYCDNFTTMDKEWNITAKGSNKDNSFMNEGKSRKIIASKSMDLSLMTLNSLRY
jgi:hypothetical protein